MQEQKWFGAWTGAVATPNLDPKASVRLSTTNNVTQTGVVMIDGVVPSVGDRVLVKSQTIPSQNGIYVVDSGNWPRASDMAAASTAAGAFMFVEEGTVNADKGFVCTSDSGADVVGTNSLTFSMYTDVAQTVTTVTSGAYTVLATDQTLSVTTSQAVTITLPLASSVVAKEFAIGDATGAGAATNKITIAMTSPDTLNGLAGGGLIEVDNGWLIVKAVKGGAYSIIGGTL
jgi:phage-related tail fiber protein